MIDDVNGDGSLLIKYYDASKTTIIGTNVITESLGSFTSELLENSYTPTNPTNPDTVGTAAIIEQRRILLQGNSWSPTPTTLEYSIRVDAVGNELTPPTFTDSEGVITNLRLNEFLAFSDIDQSDNILFDTSVTVTAGINDRLFISCLLYTSPSPRD